MVISGFQEKKNSKERFSDRKMERKDFLVKKRKAGIF